MDTAELIRLLPLLAPIVLIQLALLIVGLLDLAKPERHTRGPKWLWVAVILFFSILGPVVYFLAGREEA